MPSPRVRTFALALHAPGGRVAYRRDVRAAWRLRGVPGAAVEPGRTLAWGREGARYLVAGHDGHEWVAVETRGPVAIVRGATADHIAGRRWRYWTILDRPGRVPDNAAGGDVRAMESHLRVAIQRARLRAAQHRRSAAGGLATAEHRRDAARNDDAALLGAARAAAALLRAPVASIRVARALALARGIRVKSPAGAREVARIRSAIHRAIGRE